ncbi:MAG: aminomethyl-transferring glycine dehydrogenase subunit GcvPA [Planctomycetota bacterium]
MFTPHTSDQIRAMLDAIGAESLEALFSSIPESVRIHALNLPPALSEMEVETQIRALADSNVTTDDILCFIGAGAYDHWIPAVVPAIANRSEFVTAYTPYQPEISQGLLQSIFEYQSSIASLCGLDVANASMYDGATAALEAVTMACRAARRETVVLSRDVHPSYRATIKTGAKAMGLDIVEIGTVSFDSDAAAPQGLVSDKDLIAAIGPDVACLVVANPTFFGALRDCRPLADACAKAKALLVAVINPLSTALIKSPGEMGVSIACGDAQPFGLSLSLGGPYLGFISAEAKLVRQLPGRLIGQTVDADGRRAFTLTLQTREQHIRREKATSNICSNQALCALTAGVYMGALGPKGIRRVAETSLSGADYLKRKLSNNASVSMMRGPAFNEFVFSTPLPAGRFVDEMLERGFLGGIPVQEAFPDYAELKGNEVLVAVTEKRGIAQLNDYVNALNDIL